MRFKKRLILKMVRLADRFKLNPKLIWKLRGTVFHTEEYQQRIFAQHEWLVDKVKQLQPEKILEVGCGFGRNLELLTKELPYPPEIFGADISKQMLAKAREIANINPKNIHLASAGKLPFADATFDLVFTHGLLMHIEPTELSQSIGEILRVSKKNVIVIEQIEGNGANNYTFHHDYQDVLPRQGLEIEEQTFFQNNERSIACLCRKNSDARVGILSAPTS